MHVHVNLFWWTLDRNIAYMHYATFLIARKIESPAKVSSALKERLFKQFHLDLIESTTIIYCNIFIQKAL